MRKFQQKQLLDILKTFEEANNEIEGLLQKNDIQAIVSLLTDCQNNALKVGESIERLEGTNTKTVTMLEEYCDLLYTVSIEICQNEKASTQIRKIQKLLTKISDSIETEFKPNRIEMLFIPYKASMWDSMESVWLSAKEDPQCDAVVMPIPYFDMLPNKSFGRMHYEGNQYPDYVSITDWRKYGINNRHPDIIIMHNPYDDGNFVTSVHPDYYSNKLKENTDLLVYIPYFVSFVNNICFGSGLLFADKVIVQSESVRDAYLSEYRQFEKKNSCAGAFGNAESKFEVLGSPKFDKVLSVKPGDFNFPENWQKLIQNADGSKKRVFLLNTTISGLLNGNESVLSRLRSIFDCFRNTENVVLLWRPHPLNVSTYETMRPQLLNEYNEIVSEYRQSEWGIYDDSSDLNRAIAISDAYYGDWSSLVALFLCTGKPIMIQPTGNQILIRRNSGETIEKYKNAIECCYIEDMDMTLPQFLELNGGTEEEIARSVKQLELCSTLALNLDGTAGAKIYESLKKTNDFGGELK